MLIEYLNKRYEILNSRLKQNEEKRDHNLIAIVEANNKIDELDSSVDEASEFFSVRMREDGNFKTQEINELELRITAYITENESLEKVINKLKEELNVVTACINQVQSDNVSRETLEENREEQALAKDIDDDVYNKNRNKILEKLIFCRDICAVDSNRVRIELDDVIKTLTE